MRIEFTEMSDKNIYFLLEQNKTPEQVVEFLRTDAEIRSFGDTLRGIYKKEDLSWKLTEGFWNITGEDRGSISRKIRNWLSDKAIPKNRETLFQICFILGLDLKESGQILEMAEESRIHYRNPKELVYAYALKNRKTYKEALELLGKAKIALRAGKKEKNRKTLRPYTRQMREEFKEVGSEEELFHMLERNSEIFGELHNTAYERFETLIDILVKPQGKAGLEEELYSVDNIMKTYFRMGVPLTKRSGEFTALQKMIKKYWPSSRSIINMRNRKEDVSRKTLLLLGVITEMIEEEPDKEKYYWDESFSQSQSQDIFLKRVQDMDVLLEECGMSGLDPCCPFDYLVLYALRGTEEESMGERMEAVVTALFSKD